jgi:energy-coupling factor transporter ATP-binding protein EcfA2
MSRVKTGIQALDDLLGGGIRTGSLNLIYGAPGVGKTSLCMSVALKLCEEEGSAVVLDTESGWSEARLSGICDSLGRPGLDKMVKVYRAGTMAEQHKIASKAIEEDIEANDWTPRVVVLDSAVAHYHANLLGTPAGFLAAKARELQGRISVQVNSLVRLAGSYDSVLIATSWLKSSVGERMSEKKVLEAAIEAKKEKPVSDVEGALGAVGYGLIGGQHMAYMAKSIIRLSGTKLRNDVKALVLEKCVDAATSRVVFVELDERGITNYGEPKVFPMSEAINLVLGETK